MMRRDAVPRPGTSTPHPEPADAEVGVGDELVVEVVDRRDAPLRPRSGAVEASE